MSERTGRDGPPPPAWDARLETGVATIDLQHKVLFDLLLRTREASERGRPVDLGSLVQQLRAYASYHFQHEEDWIRQHLPPSADDDAHQRQHAGFVRWLERLEWQHGQGTLDLPSLLGFLSRWLVDHIVRQDLPLIRPLARASGASCALPGFVDAQLAVQRRFVGDEHEGRPVG